MKANVCVYRTNGEVEKMFVANPAVATCNHGHEVGIFDHCGYRCAIDDYDEWYEDVAIYYTTDIMAIYANDKCEWYNQAYIKNTNSIIAEPTKPMTR